MAITMVNQALLHLKRGVGLLIQFKKKSQLEVFSSGLCRSRCMNISFPGRRFKRVTTSGRDLGEKAQEQLQPFITVFPGRGEVFDSVLGSNN